MLPRIFSGLIFFSVINQIIRAHNVKVFPEPKQILKNEREKYKKEFKVIQYLKIPALAIIMRGLPGSDVIAFCCSTLYMNFSVPATDDVALVV